MAYPEYKSITYILMFISKCLIYGTFVIILFFRLYCSFVGQHIFIVFSLSPIFLDQNFTLIKIIFTYKIKTRLQEKNNQADHPYLSGNNAATASTRRPLFHINPGPPGNMTCSTLTVNEHMMHIFCSTLVSLCNHTEGEKEIL
jgi:hypothetical protein